MRSRWTAVILVVTGIALAVLPVLPFGTNDVLTLLISLCIIASLASSWNILAGFVGRINLGHASFFGLGALVTRELWLGMDWHPALAFVVGGAVAGLAALIIGAPALRLKGIYFSVGTLALAEAMRLTVGTLLPRISRLPGPVLRSYELAPRYWVALVVLALIVAFVYWLKHSKLGLGMMAVREDEEAAKSVGVNIFRHTLIAFILSASFAGLAGGAFAFYHVGYYPSFAFGPEWTFEALLVTFVGGIGTLTGPLVGAVFFVLISDMLSGSPELLNVHLIIFGVLFIAVVLALPGGIIEIAARLRRRFAGVPGRQAQ